MNLMYGNVMANAFACFPPQLVEKLDITVLKNLSISMQFAIK
jgi:hypothetical protein